MARTDLNLTEQVSGVLPVANGGTGSTTLAGAGIPTLSGPQTMSGTRLPPRLVTVSSSATPTLNTDNADVAQMLSLATNVTNMSTNQTGTPNHGEDLLYEIKSASSQTIAWGALFLVSGAVPQLLTVTVAGKIHRSFYIWDSVKTAWLCMAVDLIGY